MTAVRLVLDKLWRGASLTGDDIVVIVLLLAMAASIAHLLTMLATRWGDRHIAMKSLFGSLLVHGVCLLGLEVFDPLQIRLSLAQAEIYMPVEPVTQVLLQSEDDVRLIHSGNSPTPDQPSEPDIDLERIPIPARQLEESTEPAREPENLDTLQTALPDTTEFMEHPETHRSVPIEDGERGPVEVAAPDPASELETRHDQNSADAHTAETERTLPEPGNAIREPDATERRSTAGRTERIDTQVELSDSSLQIATSDFSDAIPPKPAEQDDSIRQRSAPQAGEESVEMAGVETTIHPNHALPARTFDRRLPRPERTRPSRSQTLRPSRLHANSPQTPSPLSHSYNEVRVGLTAPSTSEDLRSAGSLVELDSDRIRRRDSHPAAYHLRSQEYRMDAVRTFGGTERSEATVERSLQWLASVQSPDGHWDADEYGAGQVDSDPVRIKQSFVGRDADTGITALVTLSFLGAGYTHESGRYAIQVDRALEWLIQQQDDEGNLAGSADYYSRMYCHGMATYALAEAFGMHKDSTGPLFDPNLLAAGPSGPIAVGSMMGTSVGIPPGITGVTWSAASVALADVQAWNSRKVDDLALQTALMKAILFTLRWQDPTSGGWRYSPQAEGDVSMFGWQLMSLKSAEIAGIKIHSHVRKRMEKFIENARQGDDGGLFAYRRRDEPEPAMTAEALFCQQMLGHPRDSARNRESVDYLLDNLPRLSKLNLYYWYYGTLAMYQHGGTPWQRWNAAVRDLLISQQRTDGPLAGSWDPNGPWGRYGGRLYSTALSTLTLEVYYRLLPLYRMNDRD